MKWMVAALLCFQLLEATVVKEKGLLEEFLKTHTYDPIQKYHFSDFSVTYKPMAYMDYPGPNQEFGLNENELGTNFVYTQFDGITGMAYPALAVDGATTALWGMLQEEALTSSIFSFYLS
ncbi:Gastricsin [Pteropus alecto]|uniref:Gastricsin n=1 Tax=Pteropus alecto TaxID=9402 RepID=L5JLT4_PTEAL|nr:Gastricsin [Pteropus alecto]